MTSLFEDIHPAGVCDVCQCWRELAHADDESEWCESCQQDISSTALQLRVREILDQYCELPRTPRDHKRHHAIGVVT